MIDEYLDFIYDRYDKTILESIEKYYKIISSALKRKDTITITLPKIESSFIISQELYRLFKLLGLYPEIRKINKSYIITVNLYIKVK